ncbi:hypothetical protein RaK2_00446 [Klebsiella phage vB_KleM_RaK2]|uniref:Uncharacterized protein n=1 Tax=Klebsiella phage vB_KleM_RaK2 TaxID=1147094 RepID=H6X4Q3_9CAUD|nr:hypothetical protein F403_gp089 [Klebsiella phage vB_KleM_RaK2]AFA44719.1 hypothetical protein RaK2_00446 [Klebsiella phage vB_KleM_RaK2]
MNLEEQKKIASRKQKKGIDIKYLNKEFQIVHNPDSSFCGYRIRTEQNTLSNISEYENGTEIGIINFRPTQTPTILGARYKQYFEERYANGNISLHYTFYKSVLIGEYKKYDSDGNLTLREFYDGNGDCTKEIKEFIGFNGTDEEFMHYEFKEDEEFNILMRYGSHFKLIKEIKFKTEYFNYVYENCLKRGYIRNDLNKKKFKH